MFARFLDVASLVVLLAIVGVRPLVTETFHTAGIASDLAPGLSDPLTSHTLLINIAILGIAFRATLKRALSKRSTAATIGIEIGAGILMIAAAVACAFANDKRPAILSAIDLFGAIALVWGLVCLIDRSWMRTLLLMVVCASGLITVAGSFDQVFVTMAETEQQYEETREAMWAEKGLALDSPQVQMFENRMRSREATGYFSHSNIAGGYLLLIFFSMLGAAQFAWTRSRAENATGLPVLLLLLALSAAGGIYLSRSNGAMLAGLVMLFVLGVVLTKQTWWRTHRSGMFRIALILITAAIIGVCMLGLSTGGLPGASLDFRWQYWEVSSHILGDHWATGVGPENFGDAYMQYKSIINSEEVKNPHNFLVQFATEYGLLGLLGAVLILCGGAKAYARSRLTDDSVPADPPASSIKAYVTNAIIVGMVLFVLRYIMLPSHDPNYVKWSMLMSFPLWIVVITLGAFAVQRSQGGDGQDGFWITSIGFGLGAFLLQDAINFALFVPGARTTFAAVFAIAIVRTDKEEAERIPPTTRWIAPLVSAVALLVALATALMVVPAEVMLMNARQMQASGDDLAHGEYLESETCDPLDAAIPAEHAEWLMQLSARFLYANPDDMPLKLDADVIEQWLTWSVEAVDLAIAHAPNKHVLHRRKSQIHMFRHRVGIAGEVEIAVAALREALRLYPSRPMTHVELADCLAELQTCESLTEALDHLSTALELDARRPKWELLRRFNPRVESEIEDRIQRIKQLMHENACEEN